MNQENRLFLVSLVLLVCSMVVQSVVLAFPLEPAPTGAARVRQITSAYTVDPTKGIEQRVFNATDPLAAFQGSYFDPNDDCLPIDTEQVNILVATASGQVVLYAKADSGHYTKQQPLSDYYRGFSLPFKAGTFPPGPYIWTVIALDCTGTAWTALPYWNSFQVIE